MTDVYTKHMSRGAGECHILEDQFNLLTTNIGYLIHPSIASRLPSNARIDDVATGTGIYLQQLAESYPHATLDGYDISTVQFPDKASLALNVTLNFLDVKKAIPQELQGTYDFVHVRLLLAGMLAADWELVVHNLVQLLKPGGALQWEECNFLGAEQLRGHLESTVLAVRQIEGLLLEAFHEHFQTGWNTLDKNMVNAGLVDVSGIFMVACFSWARSGKDHVPLSPAELQKLERQAGGYVRYDIHTVFGFQPELVTTN